MKKNEVIIQALAITGAPDEEELGYLYDLVLQVPQEGVILEVGCDFGKSTSILATVAKKRSLQMNVVDNFSYYDIPAYEKFISNMDSLGLRQYFHLHKINSQAAANGFFSNTLDFIFIDADHSKEGVEKDCKSWIPKLKKKGVIAFHDYANGSFPGLTETVDTYTNGFEDLGLRKTLKAFRKP